MENYRNTFVNFIFKKEKKRKKFSSIDTYSLCVNCKFEIPWNLLKKFFFFFLVTYVRTIKKALKQTWRHRPIINGLSNKSRSRLFKKSIKGYYILHRVYLINDACVKLMHAKCDFFFFFIKWEKILLPYLINFWKHFTMYMIITKEYFTLILYWSYLLINQIQIILYILYIILRYIFNYFFLNVIQVMSIKIILEYTEIWDMRYTTMKFLHETNIND